MAQLRILRLQRGDDDHLVNAIELLTTESSNSISIVDCTLGLGSDSIIMSYAFPSAHIIGLEASYPIWLSTWFGLKYYTHEDMTVTNALRRIDARHDNFESFLQGLPNDSVDILYLTLCLKFLLKKVLNLNRCVGILRKVESQIL